MVEIEKCGERSCSPLVHTQWTHDLLGEKCPKVTFRLGNRGELPEHPRDFSKDSGFEDEDYFYLDDDYLLLPNAVTLLENKSDERLHFAY